MTIVLSTRKAPALNSVTRSTLAADVAADRAATLALSGLNATDGGYAVDVATSGPRVIAVTSGYRTTFWDDFTAADGPIEGRIAPTGQVWDDVGTGAGIVPGKIVSNAFGLVRADVGAGTPAARNYSEIILDTPPDMIGANISFVGTTGTNNACVFLVSPHDSPRTVSGFHESIVHIVLSKGGIQVDVTESGSANFVTIGSYAWGATFPADGTPGSVLIERSGDTITITGPTGETPRSFTSPVIGRVWGRSITCEAFYNATQDFVPTFGAVWAGVKTTDPAALVDGAATNYHTNPGAEGTGVSGFAASGSSTIAQSTDWNSPNDPGGTHSIKVVTGNVAGQSGVNCNSLTGLAIAAGVNVFSAAVDVNMTETLPMAAVLTVNYSGGGSALFTYAGTLVAGENFLNIGPVVADPAKVIDQVTLAVRCTQFNTVTTFYVDAVNLRRAYRTLDRVTGSAGTGYSYAGVANLSASLRATSKLTVDGIGSLDPAKGSLLIRAGRRMRGMTDQVLLDIGDGDTGHDRLRVWIGSDDQLKAGWTSNGGSEAVTTVTTQKIPTYAPLDIYVWWDGVDVGLSLFNSASAAGTRTAPSGSWGTRTDAVIGSDRDSANHAHALIHSVIAGRRRLRKDEVRRRTLDRTTWKIA